MSDADAIRRMTAELAADPRSLVFLELGEALRRLGQLGAAFKVARAGALRYPQLADAHDLLGRILADQGDRASAEVSWRRALELEPAHAGASKGLAFLAFRTGDLAAAAALLEAAAGAHPQDGAIAGALERVRHLAEAAPAPAAPAPRAAAEEGAFDFARPEGADGALLFDAAGERLAGRLLRADGSDAGDAVAAHLAGVSREAERAARVLDLGTWEAVVTEAADANVIVVPAGPGTALLVTRDPMVPAARLVRLAEQGARAARAWLERLG